MKSTIEQVREFHEAFNVANKPLPDIDDFKINDLRIKLIGEELMELANALDENSKVKTLDALIDLQYVLDGTFLQLGFASVKDAAFAEVHRSNMSKLGANGKPIKREDGKVVKGSNYSPPYLTPYV